MPLALMLLPLVRTPYASSSCVSALALCRMASHLYNASVRVRVVQFSRLWIAPDRRGKKTPPTTILTEGKRGLRSMRLFTCSRSACGNGWQPRKANRTCTSPSASPHLPGSSPTPSHGQTLSWRSSAPFLQLQQMLNTRSLLYVPSARLGLKQVCAAKRSKRSVLLHLLWNPLRCIQRCTMWLQYVTTSRRCVVAASPRCCPTSRPRLTARDS
mmetsp:Transcript_16339/g.49758  ORF Transcript_16339/g.49758 Transcript_16339/m.49758 type:complete len:213 (+) Transcript_16339:2390-3028(+)